MTVAVLAGPCMHESELAELVRPVYLHLVGVYRRQHVNVPARLMF